MPGSAEKDVLKGDSLQAESLKSLKKKSLGELRNAAISKEPGKQIKSDRRYFAFIRSQAIKLYALARANGVCEGCSAPAPFESKTGPYLECHHLYRVADGGPDHPANVVAICPNCHRRAHYSKDATDFNKELMKVAAQKEAALQNNQ